MIRLSRTGAIIRGAAYLAAAMLGVVGCAQNGIGNGGTGGTGTGGSAAGGNTGAGGGGGVATTCPAAAPTNGALCSGDLQCSYGSQTCCGVTYASQSASCLNGKFSVGFVETPCQIGGGSCGGAAGAVGAAGASGAAGAGGISCPADPTPEGFSCFPDEVGGGHGCTYGSTICCGVTYPTLLVTCQSGDAIVHQAVETPCSNTDYVCPTAGNGGGGAGGAGGMGGAGGGGGAGGAGVCPTLPPAAGSSCDWSLECSYGSVSCCGATYPTTLVSCGPNGVEQQPFLNPCGSPCPIGGASGHGSGGAGGAVTF